MKEAKEIYSVLEETLDMIRDAGRICVDAGADIETVNLLMDAKDEVSTGKGRGAIDRAISHISSIAVEKMEDITYRIGPKSFYQTNSLQAYRLYSVVRDFADLKGDEILYDLYTGTGTIALFLARKARKVIGVEYVEEAVADARINSKDNGIDNAEFFAGDMKDVLDDGFIKKHGKPDVIVLDPPRAGIHPSVAQVILKASPDRMVYVSCNPASQARDLEILCKDYTITKVQPVDMFPHTQHVENVVLLERKK